MTPASTSTAVKRDLKTPRFWLGCDGMAFLRVMMKGGFRFDPSYRYMGAILSTVGFGHSVCKIAQHAIYGLRIANTPIARDPIFIIGHWRTGTTLLHELMILDPEHNFPTTHQCFDPNHFLLTAGITKKWCKFLIGDKRPMDQMAMSWDRPQEDEFAMCLMGQPSPYLQIAFPNNPEIDPEAYDLENLSPRDRRLWEEAFLRFLKTITFLDPRRLVLKSPPHSCRIPTLLKMFPNAKFVHIVRNPHSVYPSTMHLWRSLGEKHGFQTPRNPELKERVLQRFTHLYRRIEETKGLIPAGQFHELSYENLVASPVEEMRKIYDGLKLDGFDAMKPRLKSYLQQNSCYETNKFACDAEDTRDVAARWKDVIERYGYADARGTRVKAG